MSNMFGGFYDISARDRDYYRFTFQGSPVQAQQLQWEFTQLLSIYSALKPAVTLEIGSADGGTLYQWMKHAGSGQSFIAIEPHLNDGRRDMWSQWAGEYGQDLHMLGMDSHDQATVDRVCAILAGREVDFLFIDGDHSYAGSRRDFETYGPLVRKGGIISLHDIVMHSGVHAPNGPDPCCVFQTWLDIVEAGYVTQTLISERCQPRCGIGLVYVGV